MEKKDYYLGLDMGTSSVGWAVTDENYQLLRAKGKDLWGIREFEEAQTAVDRRTHRISRRRRQRELVRIGLLKYYFSDAIAEVDPLFYQRLKNSKYHLEDKADDVQNKNGIFNDGNYTDKEYFAEYPTIFHLRKELITNEKSDTHDVRFVYLALLNMFKHRGHFLNAGLGDGSSERKLGEVYVQFVGLLSDITDVSFPTDIKGSLIEDILSSRDYNRTKKSEELCKVLGVDLKDKKRAPYIKAICGLKVNVKQLFDEITIDEDKKVEICFSDFAYDDNKQEIIDILGDEQYQVIELMKEIYDIGSLAGIKKGYTYLSEARVADYEKHKKDLEILKHVMKKYKTKDEYNDLFRTENDGTYSAYVGSYNSGSKQRRDMKGRKSEDLYKTIKKLLKDVPQDDDVRYILDEIDKDAFLPKQLTASNGIIPNQVHAMEMKKILSNAEAYLPFLKEKDESGLTVSERILRLFSFQIPYYIGPTSEKSKTGWVVRKEEGQILPWNIEQKIDVKGTSEQFITKMVRRCTYINDERVLPKSSLEYESFCVLNEINNIKINGERISAELKQDIYVSLFQKGKKVTKRQLINFFFGKGLIEEEEQVSGIDININNYLSSYGKFKAIFGESIDEDKTRHMIEDIIFWCTVYGDSKKFLKERLEEKYSDKLSQEQIKRIMGFKFKDWGNLSKEFLEISGCDKSDGEAKSLIRMMWERNLNLMELINDDRYSYKEALADRQSEALKTLSDITAEDLEDCYFSAPVRRMVWQTILIIRELTEVLGAPPKRLFVEMTRKPDDKKQRTVSRKQKFLDLYKKEGKDWKDIIEKADGNGTLRSKKMYLYLTQKGRCMYTGKPIELADLFNDNLYDIDHIYPRHFVKDDNIDNNLVLVDKRTNARKSDKYPLEESIYLSQKNMWKELLSTGLISEEKYNRLIGRNEFTDEQMAGFIARQLVETSQGTKGVTEILKQILPDTKIVYSKASNVSEFRQKRGLPKSRLINDFHHAHDAYLNIVVGNVYFVKFTQNPLNFISKEYRQNMDKNRYNLSRMFDWDVVRGNEVAWIAQKDGEGNGTIATVKSVMSKNTPMMTRYNFEKHCKLSDENLVSARRAKKDRYIPFKATDKKVQDVTKYGGFANVFASYFFLVEHELRGKRVRTIETVPIYMKERVEKKPDELLTYCTEQLGLDNPIIRLPKIKIQSLIKINGYFAYLSAKTGNQISVTNAMNLCLNSEWIDYVKRIEKVCEKGEIDDCVSTKKNEDLYIELKVKHMEGGYKNRPNSMGKKLDSWFDNFKKLGIVEQCKVLANIISMSSITGNDADLSLIGGSGQCGKMQINKNITGVKEMALINQSVTGLFENRIDLLTV